MRTQKFGIEIEMTGITRAAAAQVIAGHFGTSAIHVGGIYDAFAVRDGDSRQWKVVSDSSIRRESRRGESRNAAYAVEFVSPICKYEDIETIQELIRKLRSAGAKVNSSCGIHIHIDATPHDVKTLRNIVNIMAAKEDLLYKSLKVDVHREHYCAKADTRFLDELNAKRPRLWIPWSQSGTMAGLVEIIIMMRAATMGLTCIACSPRVLSNSDYLTPRFMPGR